jgi:iron complex transport system substrate-binding protein
MQHHRRVFATFGRRNLQRQFASGARVASLLPAATEILCAMGDAGEKLLVGRSHEDNFPASIEDRPILTGQRANETWTSAKEVNDTVSTMLSDSVSLYTVDAELLLSLQVRDAVFAPVQR